MILEARTQHRADRPHDCVVCRTTAARMTAREVAPIRVVTSEGIRRQSYVTCGKWMGRVKDYCAHHQGHPGQHGSRAYLDREALKRRRDK